MLGWNQRRLSRRFTGRSPSIRVNVADQRICAVRRGPGPPPSATRPCVPGSRKPRTRERLATDGRYGSGYADRPSGCPARPRGGGRLRTARLHDPAGFRQHSSYGREGPWRTGDVARPTAAPPNPAATQVNRPQDRRYAGIAKTVTPHTAARRHRQLGRGCPATRSAYACRCAAWQEYLRAGGQIGDRPAPCGGSLAAWRTR